MASAAQDTYLAELQQLKAQWEPELEGLRDFAALNIAPATLLFVKEQITRYERRLALLAAELQRVEDLRTDGYPDMPRAQVPPGIQTDLGAQLVTLNAAYGTIEALPEAVSGAITPGALEPIEGG